MTGERQQVSAEGARVAYCALGSCGRYYVQLAGRQAEWVRAPAKRGYSAIYNTPFPV